MQQSTTRGSGLIQIGRTFVRGSYLHDRCENGEGRCRIRLTAAEGVPLAGPAGRSEWIRLPGETEWKVTHCGVLDQGEHIWLDFEGVIAKDSRTAAPRRSDFRRHARGRARAAAT